MLFMEFNLTRKTHYVALLPNIKIASNIVFEFVKISPNVTIEISEFYRFGLTTLSTNLHALVLLPERLRDDANLIC